MTLCQGPRMSWPHGHGETGRCPTPGLSANGGGTSPSARDCRARAVCRGLSSWTTSWPPWDPATHTTRCCWPGLPWTPPTPCATCTWRKATSCGQAGHHGSTWVTVDPGRPPCCSSIGPLLPPHLRTAGFAARLLVASRAGEAVYKEQCGRRCPAFDALHLQRQGVTPFSPCPARFTPGCWGKYW